MAARIARTRPAGSGANSQRSSALDEARVTAPGRRTRSASVRSGGGPSGRTLATVR